MSLLHVQRCTGFDRTRRYRIFPRAIASLYYDRQVADKEQVRRSVLSKKRSCVMFAKQISARCLAGYFVHGMFTCVRVLVETDSTVEAALTVCVLQPVPPRYSYLCWSCRYCLEENQQTPEKTPYQEYATTRTNFAGNAPSSPPVAINQTLCAIRCESMREERAKSLLAITARIIVERGEESLLRDPGSEFRLGREKEKEKVRR